MCGRYVRRSDKQKIAEHFHVHGPSLPDFWAELECSAADIPALSRATGEREIVLMLWGLVPF
jgi:putative SOS response-associated peptidase YedK